MLEDLTMLANQTVVDTEAGEKAKAEADKAAAGETMPPPKHKGQAPECESDDDRIARRGQDPPEQEKAGEEDR